MSFAVLINIANMMAWTTITPIRASNINERSQYKPFKLGAGRSITVAFSSDIIKGLWFGDPQALDSANYYWG